MSVKLALTEDLIKTRGIISTKYLINTLTKLTIFLDLVFPKRLLDIRWTKYSYMKARVSNTETRLIQINTKQYSWRYLGKICLRRLELQFNICVSYWNVEKSLTFDRCLLQQRSQVSILWIMSLKLHKSGAMSIKVS